MTTFDAEQVKTSEKMSDLVMERVSQIIAGDFLEMYEKVIEKSYEDFVSNEFDEYMYKKITKTINKTTKRSIRTLRLIFLLITAITCIACIAFTVTALLHETIRNEVIRVLLSFLNLI